MRFKHPTFLSQRDTINQPTRPALTINRILSGKITSSSRWKGSFGKLQFSQEILRGYGVAESRCRRDERHREREILRYFAASSRQCELHLFPTNLKVIRYQVSSSLAESARLFRRRYCPQARSCNLRVSPRSANFAQTKREQNSAKSRLCRIGRLQIREDDGKNFYTPASISPPLRTVLGGQRLSEEKHRIEPPFPPLCESQTRRQREMAFMGLSKRRRKGRKGGENALPSRHVDHGDGREREGRMTKGNNENVQRASEFFDFSRSRRLIKFSRLFVPRPPAVSGTVSMLRAIDREESRSRFIAPRGIARLSICVGCFFFCAVHRFLVILGHSSDYVARRCV